MDFKKYYGRRLNYMFHFTKQNLEYRIVKIICLIVGIPLSIVLFLFEMAITLVYMLFMWIPFVNLGLLFICRILTTVCSIGFYISILPDLTYYFEECEEELIRQREQMEYEYSINDSNDNQLVEDVNEQNTEDPSVQVVVHNEENKQG